MRVLLPFSSRRKKSDSESTSSTSVSGETVTSTNSSSNASNSEGTSSGSENSFGGHSPEEELAATVVSPFKKSLQSNDANQPSTEVIFERAKAHQGFLFELEEAEGEDNKVSPSQEPLKTALEGGFDVPEELQQTAPSFSVASVAKTHPYQPGFLLRDQTKKADSSSSQLLHSKRLAPSSLSAAVSDWATFGSTCFAHPPSSTPFDDIAADQTQRRSKKRLASSPVRDTPHCFDVVEPSITADIKVASILSAKRPRPDSKPAAKVLTPVPHTITNMAVGGRHKSDSDDESVIHQAPPRFWIQPAENEPPILQNHPVGVPPVAASCPANPHDPALDHGLDPALEGVGEEQSATDIVTVTETDKDDASLALFCDSLKKQGLEMVEQEGDGNCLFRAVSLQVYGSPDNHGEVRERCLDFMARNEEHYSSFVVAVASDDEDSIPVERAKSAFQAYILRKRINGVHGNHAEIQAISELFNRPIEVYTPGVTASHGQPQKPMNIFHAEYKTSDPPIRLSYHDGNHYNAIIDPLVPTAGLGLGLPGLKPGLADQMQVTKAKAESDQLADEMEFERVLKESQEELNGQQDDDLQRVLKESSRDFVRIGYYAFPSLVIVGRSCPANINAVLTITCPDA